MHLPANLTSLLSQHILALMLPLKKIGMRSALSLLFFSCSLAAHAERYDNTTIQEISSSGQTLVLNVGTTMGIRLKEPVLLRRGADKLVAARIVKVESDRSVAYIVERFGEAEINPGEGYTLLWGNPNVDASYRPDDLSDINTAPENPQNEKFQENEMAQESPDLDDDGQYNPEVIVAPRLPGPRTYSPHHITVGVGVYRNADLDKTLAAIPERDATKTYSGYALRYQYNFRTSYWLDRKVPALLGVEAGFGIYNFSHTFANGRGASIRVIPVSFNFKYNLELSKLLRVYPYLGFQNRIVNAQAESTEFLADLRGVKIMAGIGAGIVMSSSMDARFDVGIDGYLFGVVAKF